MECKRCGNRDPTYFYLGHNGWYCRKCVSFKRLLLEEEPDSVDYDVLEGSHEYNLGVNLTPFQEDVADKCLSALKDSDVLLHCVCGAGKTEIVVKSISAFLNRGLRVCYAIPRKEVVIELSQRFKRIFPKARVTSLYGGHHDELTGDLIICTTHQLFRYHQVFDLLVLDEADAFPLSGNKELMNIAINSSRGRIIFSTATLNDFLMEYLSRRVYKVFHLTIRPNRKPMVVPKDVYGPSVFLFFYLIHLLRKMTNQCIIFVSSKRDCKMLYLCLRCFFSVTYVYADLPERNDNIKAFRDKKYKYIVATSVLERGITVFGVNVIISGKKFEIFNKENLVQMFGRVGRDFNNPYGEAYILSPIRSKVISEAIDEIRSANKASEMYFL